MKRAGLILAVLLVVAAGFSLLAWRQYQAFLATPLSIPQGGIVFELTPGSSGGASLERSKTNQVQINPVAATKSSKWESRSSKKKMSA